jgi:phthiocerol/phenolphthiocerol synthesis type-I polyketide synthase D
VDGPLPRDLGDWVAFHREHLDRLPVVAPFHLAGFSFGGVIALEIAMQLRDEGQEVAWLGLIDTIRPILNPTGLRPYLRYHLRELVDQPDPVRRRAHLRRMLLGGGRRTLLRARHQLLRPLRWAGLLPASRGATVADTRGLGALKKAVWRGYLTHEARPYDAPVALFTGFENRRQAGGDPSLRWSTYLRNGLEVVPLPGEHKEILRPPNVEVAAREIAASLDRAAQRRARRPRT